MNKKIAMNAICYTLLVAMAVAGIWLRFSTTGLELFYEFTTRTADGRVSDAMYGWAIAGMFAGALVLSLVIMLIQRRRRNFGLSKATIPPAALLMALAFAVPVIGFVAYGHYFG